MLNETIIIIPTFNERKNLEQLIPAIFDLMPDISILIVDDNSNDGTGGLVKDLLNSYKNLHLLERTSDFGYGKACSEGFNWIFQMSHLAMSRHSMGDYGDERPISQDGPIGFRYIVTMDADFSHDFHAIPEMLKKLENNDVVIGSRYVAGGRIENWKWHRRILSRLANFYVRAILRLTVKDATTGFNCYRKEALLKSDFNSIKSNGYAFLVELKYKLAKSGVKISEYPIVFSERREGQSKMSGKIIWESILLPWRLK